MIYDGFGSETKSLLCLHSHTHTHTQTHTQCGNPRLTRCEKAKEAKVEKSEGAAGANDTPAGWSWSALAAMEGVNNINSNLYGEVLPDGCALMFKSL